MATHIMKPSYFSYLLVFVQFASIAGILLTGNWFIIGYGISWQIAGIALGLWAVKVMHLGEFNIVPDPKPDALLVQSGPYRLIRHPMYLSLLLFFIPLVLNDLSLVRLLFLSMLIATLVVKLHYEENLLKATFEDYDQYQQKSYKLIPFIF